MRPLTYLQLGNFFFQNFAVPEKIPGGGRQLLGVHQLVGGQRIVDAMGPSDMVLAWEGMFLGDPNTGVAARDEAQYIDYLRKQGGPLTLSWDVYRYQVVIEDFTWDYEKWFQIPYKITCCVVVDMTTPVAASPDPQIDELLYSDMGNVLTTGISLGMAVPSVIPTILGGSAGASLAITWAATAL